jgi:hypothetical protein
MMISVIFLLNLIWFLYLSFFCGCHGCQNLKFKPLNAGWNEDPVTPIFAKTFLDKSSKVTSLMHLDEADKVKLQDASTEECGQPSPVSILESPFLDEIQTTSEESVSGNLEKKTDSLCIEVIVQN